MELLGVGSLEFGQSGERLRKHVIEWRVWERYVELERSVLGSEVTRAEVGDQLKKEILIFRVGVLPNLRLDSFEKAFDIVGSTRRHKTAKKTPRYVLWVSFKELGYCRKKQSSVQQKLTVSPERAGEDGSASLGEMSEVLSD